jgi:hypothetical protein
MQADIRDVLASRYGTERDFPEWSPPFFHAVGILDELWSAEDHSVGKEGARDVGPPMPEDEKQEVSTERKDEEEGTRMREKEAEASLLSVSWSPRVSNVSAHPHPWTGHQTQSNA